MQGSRFAWSAVAAATIATGLLGSPTASGDSTASPTPVPTPSSPVPAKVAPKLPASGKASAAPADTSSAAILPSSAAAAGALPASASATSAATGDVIECTLTVFSPIEFSGVVQGQTTVFCTGPALIELGSELFYDGVIPVGSPGLALGVTTAATNSYSLCLNGPYYNAAVAAIEYPPGYVPVGPPLIGADVGPTSITCS